MVYLVLNCTVDPSINSLNIKLLEIPIKLTHFKYCAFYATHFFPHLSDPTQVLYEIYAQ